MGHGNSGPIKNFLGLILVVILVVPRLGWGEEATNSPGNDWVTKSITGLGEPWGSECRTAIQNMASKCVTELDEVQKKADAATATIKGLVESDGATQTLNDADDSTNAIQKYVGKKVAAFDLASQTRSSMGNVQGLYLSLNKSCVESAKSCRTSCSQEQADKIENDQQKVAAKEALRKATLACDKKGAEIIGAAKKAIANAELVAKGASAAKDQFMGSAAWVGGGAGALLLYKDHKDSAENRRKSEARKGDRKNAVVKSESGDRIDCKLASNYANPECREALLGFCSNKENFQKGNCGAFSALYCSTPGASQSYCLLTVAAAYCQNSSVNSSLSSSPACQWVNSRPSLCNSRPDDMRCLSSMTPVQLASVCASYDRDPLCQANKAGTVVTQPGNSTTAGSNFGTASSSSSSSSFASITNSASPSTNLWATSSAALQQACTDKSLNCH